MGLAAKLQIQDQNVRVVNCPDGIDLGDVPTNGGESMLVFAGDLAALHKHGTDAFAAAAEDKLTWIAYPKAGQLGTDLNRDTLVRAVAQWAPGIRPVRQVSIDETWSALRFRPRGPG